ASRGFQAHSEPDDEICVILSKTQTCSQRWRKRMYKVALLLFSLAGSLLPSMTAAAAPKWVKCTFNQGGPPDAAPESQTPKDVIAVLNDDAKGFSEYGSLNQLLRP